MPDPAAVADAHTPGLHPEIARLDAAAHRVEIVHQGRRVCWRRWGQGKPLVLIHGGHGNWMHWVRNIDALAQRHAVWVPDLPGFGDSEELALEPHAAERQGHLLDAVMSSLDAVIGSEATIDLVGFSFGGLVAAELAARRGHVRRMALIGPTGHGTARREKVPMVNWRSPDRAQRLAGLRHNLAAFMLHDPAAMNELAMAVHEAACSRTRYRSKAISRDSGHLQAALDGHEQPLLLIWGEHDVTAVPHDIAPQLAEPHDTREWCVVPRAGHWVQFEAAADVNPLLSGWFAPDEGEIR